MTLKEAFMFISLNSRNACAWGFSAALLVGLGLSPEGLYGESFSINKPIGRVLILDFGLDDDTLLPNVPDELARTASIAPYVRTHLGKLGHRILPWAGDEEILALTVNGYYIAHPNAAAEIGRELGADWVIVGRQRKFSFLISWVRAYVIDVRTELVVARAESDLRGSMTDERITNRTALHLSKQIDELLVELADRKFSKASDE